MSTLYLADAPTYASHIAAYPENGAAILALPAGTRRYIEDMQCEVRRSTDGKYWIPDHMPSGHVFNGTNAHWIGPQGVFTYASSSNQTQRVFRPSYFRMPGFRQATISRISIYQSVNGTVGSGSDSCVIRLYSANPDGSPIENKAPLFVWDFNAAGSGGAAALSLASSGNNATRLHADVPGGPCVVPPHFWLGFAHDFQGAAPTVSSFTSVPGNEWPAALNGTDVANAVSPNRSCGYEWTQSAPWTIGDALVWPSGTELAVASLPIFSPMLKVTG